MADIGTTSIQVIELGADNSLTLPNEIAQVLGPGSRILVLKQEDTIILKRILPPRITDIVANTPETEPPLTLEEINEIVHEVRRQQQCLDFRVAVAWSHVAHCAVV